MYMSIYNTFKMKKYMKMGFFILFLFTSVGFIVYRTEYLKLRYAFEVGGLLSPPELPLNCLRINDSIADKYEEYTVFSRPRNNWINVKDFHVFSAFVETVNENLVATALGVGDKDNCKKYTCYLWFTRGGQTFAKGGTFTCDSVKESLDKTMALEFYCKIVVSAAQGAPYMFVFVDEFSHRYFIPVFWKSGSSKSSNRTALCVLPDYSVLPQLSIIEFLSYHQLIGFTDVVLYDNSIHYGIFNKLEHVLYHINYLRSFSIISWNFPFADFILSKELIARDCLYRTSSRVEFVTILSWNEFLVPVRSDSLQLTLNKFHMSDKTKLMNIETMDCCLNSVDHKMAGKSWPVIFKKTECIQNSSSSIKVNFLPNPISLMTIPQSEMYISRYVVCNYSNHNVIQNREVLKFLPDLMENKLLGIWRSGILFNT